MDQFDLHWIDQDATEGPLFRIGERDIYSRERAGSRIIRLRAIHSPKMSYVAPATEAFRTMAQHWGCPVLFVIEPVLRGLPNAGFLLEWGRAAHANRSVDQVFMVINIHLPRTVKNLLCEKFSEGGMPFEFIRGEPALQKRFKQLNTTTGWDGFSLAD